MKAKGSPKKGINAKTVTATINGIEGEHAISNVLSSMWGQGMAVTLQTKSRSAVQAELDRMLNDKVDGAYQIATDAIPSKIELDFGQYILSGGTGNTTVDPIVAGQARYKVLYNSAIDKGMSEEKALAYADGEMLKQLRSQ